MSIYVASLDVLDRPDGGQWTRVATPEDGVMSCAASADTLFLRTARDAPRFQVVATPLAAPDLAHARVVVPPGDGVIQDLRVAGDQLLISELVGGVSRLRRVPLGGGAPEVVPLPIAGTLLHWDSAPGSALAALELTSWTVAPRILLYDAASGAVRDPELSSPAPVDLREIEVAEVVAPGRDGTPIPLSIIHRRGLVRDGNNPTLLFGYGAYGISASPRCLPEMLAWYERGGVYAIAHVRGGEGGAEWHAAGRLGHKQTTIDDFIACAEYLIAHGYTSPARLAAEGVSAGGIPAGCALAQRPELWGAVVLLVPLVNPLRLEASEYGAQNAPEFGTVTTPEGFASLLISDTYHQIQDGVAYPPVLISAGLNDPYAPVWHASKLAARLQAATAADHPILLRVDFGGGHALSTTQQASAERADVLAFLLYALGAH